MREHAPGEIMFAVGRQPCEIAPKPTRSLASLPSASVCGISNPCFRTNVTRPVQRNSKTEPTHQTMQRDPRLNPRPGGRGAKVLTNRRGVTGVFSRAVLALEKRHPRGTTVVYARKRANRPYRCSLREWRPGHAGQPAFQSHIHEPVLSRSFTALPNSTGRGI